jgi:hypothetical protein
VRHHLAKELSLDTMRNWDLTTSLVFFVWNDTQESCLPWDSISGDSLWPSKESLPKKYSRPAATRWCHCLF